VLRRLVELDARRRALVVWGLAWVLISKTALAAPGGSLTRWERWLGRLAAHLPAPPSCTRDEAAWAITAAARRVPATRCLEWSLALRGLFAQAGIACELRIGVTAAGLGAIKAHAWIESGGQSWSWGETAGYNVLRSRPVGP
jgi:Transglutaminase-like superfamily